jgi:hypothetical protein
MIRARTRFGAKRQIAWHWQNQKQKPEAETRSGSRRSHFILDLPRKLERDKEFVKPYETNNVNRESADDRRIQEDRRESIERVQSSSSARD